MENVLVKWSPVDQNQSVLVEASHQSDSESILATVAWLLFSGNIFENVSDASSSNIQVVNSGMIPVKWQVPT